MDDVQAVMDAVDSKCAALFGLGGRPDESPIRRHLSVGRVSALRVLYGSSCEAPNPGGREFSATTDRGPWIACGAVASF